MATGGSNPVRIPAARVVEIVTSLVEGARVRGDSISARCPFHDDHNPSWNLTISKGVWYCHGCQEKGNLVSLVSRLRGVPQGDAFREILGEAGDRTPASSTSGDPFAGLDAPLPAGSAPASPRDSSRDEPEAIYSYYNAEGNLVFQVLRFPKKVFRQRRPNGQGWVWSVPDQERALLYRLPDVLRAVRAGEAIVLVEGEKDANSAYAHSQCGTTAPGGSGAWRTYGPRLAEFLRGAKVLAIPDYDTAGIAWAEAVLEHVGPVAAQLRFARAAEGKDLSDHFERGYDWTELLPIRTEMVPKGVWFASPAKLLDVRMFASTEPPPVSWLLPQRIARGDRCLIVGPSGARKSWLVGDLAICVALGIAPWSIDAQDWEPQRGTVLWLDEENPPDEIWRRIRLLATGHDLCADDLVELSDRLILPEPAQGLTFRDEHGVAGIHRLVLEHDPTLVILDSVTAFADLADDNRAFEVRRFMDDRIRAVVHLGGGYRTVACIHHSNKGVERGDRVSDVSAYIRGSGDWRAAADSVLFVLPSGPDTSSVIANKIRRGTHPNPLAVTLSKGILGGLFPRITGELERTSGGGAGSQVQTGILSLLRMNGGMLPVETLVRRAIDTSKVGEGTTRRSLGKLVSMLAVELLDWTAAYPNKPWKETGKAGRAPKVAHLTMLGESMLSNREEGQ